MHGNSFANGSNSAGQSSFNGPHVQAQSQGWPPCTASIYDYTDWTLPV